MPPLVTWQDDPYTASSNLLHCCWFQFEENGMTSFWLWLRAEIAPDGLSDTVLAVSASAFAWVITDLIRLVFA